MAVVKVTMNFEPNKVNIQKKNCHVEGKETVCINATVCFDVKLKSKEDRIYTAGEYNMYTKYFGAGGQYICSHIRKSSKILYFLCDRDLHFTLAPVNMLNLEKKIY